MSKPNPNRTAKVTPIIDVADPKYQVSKEHAPDKTDTWPMPMEKDGWIMAHDTLRYEMKLILEALEAVASRAAKDTDSSDNGWIVEYIQSIWKIHEDHVHDHHHNEDGVLVPVLKTKFHWPEKLEADHKELEAIMTKLNGCIMGMKPTSLDGLGEIIKLWKEYQVMMKPHLLEEEQTTLPLLRAYFEPKEIIPVTQKIVQSAPKTLLGACINTLGGKEEFSEFMKQEKIPGFVWYIEFGPAYRNYLKVFVAKIDALKSGTKIEEPAKTLLQKIFCCL